MVCPFVQLPDCVNCQSNKKNMAQSPVIEGKEKGNPFPLVEVSLINLFDSLQHLHPKNASRRASFTAACCPAQCPTKTSPKPPRPARSRRSKSTSQGSTCHEGRSMRPPGCSDGEKPQHDVMKPMTDPWEMVCEYLQYTYIFLGGDWFLLYNPWILWITTMWQKAQLPVHNSIYHQHSKLMVQGFKWPEQKGILCPLLF